MFLQPSNLPRRSRRASRGFTLIELMVVVLIIGVTAALATPTMTEQVKERRSRDTAQRIAQLYSGARMRALGRGSAVMVRYEADKGFRVIESIQGVTAATAQNAASASCAAQPGLGCLANNWAAGADTWREVTTLVPLSTLTVTATAADATQAAMNICFTPMGRSFISFDKTLPPTQAMVGAVTVGVQRNIEGTSLKGLLRTVAILPNGMARLGL